MDTNKCIHKKCLPLFKIDLWESRKHDPEAAILCPAACISDTEQGWHVWQKYWVHQEPSFSVVHLVTGKGTLLHPEEFKVKAENYYFCFCINVFSIYTKILIFYWEMSSEKYHLWTIFIHVCIYKYCAYYTTVALFLRQIWAFQGATMQKSNKKNRRKYTNPPSACAVLVVLSIMFSWCLRFGARLITVEAIFHDCPENQTVIIRREEWTWVRVISMEIWRGAILV